MAFSPLFLWLLRNLCAGAVSSMFIALGGKRLDLLWRVHLRDGEEGGAEGALRATLGFQLAFHR